LAQNSIEYFDLYGACAKSRSPNARGRCHVCSHA
jgi:hypothetical protein